MDIEPIKALTNYWHEAMAMQPEHWAYGALFVLGIYMWQLIIIKLVRYYSRKSMPFTRYYTLLRVGFIAVVLLQLALLFSRISKSGSGP